jgi:Pin2-interacting protein X1
MTIVATEDPRNGEWKKDNKGSTLLKKMGWSEGEGLGKNRQGTAVALRAVKRADSLGIGASTADTQQGVSGWESTTDGFASVLKGLKQHHGNGSSSSSDGDGDDKKKKKRKRKRKELVLARNKVTAGHSQKMRESKCLKNKSEVDMAAIFGTKLLPRKNGEDEKTSTGGSGERKRLKSQDSSV